MLEPIRLPRLGLQSVSVRASGDLRRLIPYCWDAFERHRVAKLQQRPAFRPLFRRVCFRQAHHRADPCVRYIRVSIVFSLK